MNDALHPWVGEGGGETVSPSNFDTWSSNTWQRKVPIVIDVL